MAFVFVSRVKNLSQNDKRYTRNIIGYAQKK